MPIIKAPVAAAASGGYSLLGSTTLGSSATTISVASFAAKEQLFIVIDVPTVLSGSANHAIQFNSDTGANYGSRVQVNGGYNVFTGATSLQIQDLSSSIARTTFIQVQNRASYRKRVHFEGIASTDSSSVFDVSGAGIWDNTSAQITTVLITAGGTITFPANTKLTVYGMD